MEYRDYGDSVPLIVCDIDPGSIDSI